MFIYNLRLNLKNIVKILFIFMVLLVTIFFIISLIKIVKTSFKVRDKINSTDVAIIEAENYTDILKCVYENLDNYIGQKISFTGYVYRAIDFNEKQFVLARDMIVDSKLQTLIVGFLCESKEIKNFDEDSWVKITGKISKGDYHGEIPVIKVMKIEKVDKPENELVYPPKDTYIPTASLSN